MTRYWSVGNYDRKNLRVFKVIIDLRYFKSQDQFCLDNGLFLILIITP